MRRIRRMSVEVIRRELSLSLIRPGGASDLTRPGPTTVDGHPTPECPVCRSRWLMLPAATGEDAAIMQRVLETNAIHNQLLLTGELLVCARSFELQAGTSNVTNSADTTPSQPNDPAREKSPSHD